MALAHGCTGRAYRCMAAQGCTGAAQTLHTLQAQGWHMAAPGQHIATQDDLGAHVFLSVLRFVSFGGCKDWADLADARCI